MALSSIHSPVSIFLTTTHFDERLTVGKLNRIHIQNRPPLVYRIGAARSATGFGDIGKKGDTSLPTNKELAGWSRVSNADEISPGSSKAVILNGKGYVISQLGDSYFGVEANCAACQFPVFKGQVDPKPSLTCPLCHTEFSLVDGSPLTWCPKDSLVTSVIGTLKGRSTRSKILVVDVKRSRDGGIYLKL